MTGELRTWTLKDIYDDLCTKGDLPKALNVSEARVHHWMRSQEQVKCPLPVKRLSHIHVYSLQEWKDWYTAWLAKHPNNKQVTEGKPYGHGEAFWSHFQRHESDDD